MVRGQGACARSAWWLWTCGQACGPLVSPAPRGQCWPVGESGSGSSAHSKDSEREGPAPAPGALAQRARHQHALPGR